MNATEVAHGAQRRLFAEPIPTKNMNYPLFAGSLALAATLLPLSYATASSSPVALGDHGEKTEVQVAELLSAVVADIKNETTYECTCSTGETTKEECASQNAPAAKFVALLSKGSEDTMKMVLPLAVDAVSSKDLDHDSAESFVGMFLKSQNRSVTGVAEAMHEAAPKQFSAHALLGFCEMGSESLVAPLTARVKKGSADVASAAYLAFSGDKVGRKVLKEAASVSEVSATNALDVLLAGHALQQLGDDAAVARAQGAVHAATLEALDAGEIESARAMAIAATVASHSMRSSKPTFSILGIQCSEKAEKYAKHGKLASADEIFELIEELTPAG